MVHDRSLDTVIEFFTRNLLTANVMLILGFTLFGGAYAGRLFQRLYGCPLG